MNIYLLGFMGCGKTTVGKRLASRYDCLSVDTDELFETKFNCSIDKYFELYGEDRFRKEEMLILKETKLFEEAVVSVGGGIPCYYNNMDWMLSHGICVYLEMPPKALYSRLKNNISKRPLLQTDNLNLLKNIENLLSQREYFYRKAHITVSGLNVDINDLCRKITYSFPSKK